MKRIFFCFFLLLSAVTLRAQDILVTETGDAIQAWGVDMASSRIYYRTEPDENAPIQSIAKSAVLLWKKADGSRVIIAQDGTPTKVDAAPTTPATTAPATVKADTLKKVAPKTKVEESVHDVSDPVVNIDCIRKFNNRDMAIDKSAKSSAAKDMLAILNITDGSVIADKNVELSFAPYHDNKAWNTEGYGFSVTAKNKTDRTVYVQLANALFLRHGVSTPFEAMPAQSNDSIGVPAFAQSVIAIPAHSSMNLGNQVFFAKENADNLFGEEFTFELDGPENSPRWIFTWTRDSEDPIHKYETRLFSAGDTPLDFGFKLTYSFSESSAQVYRLDAQFFVAKVVGAYYYPGSGVFIDKPVYFYICQKMDKSSSIFSDIFKRRKQN